MDTTLIIANVYNAEGKYQYCLSVNSTAKTPRQIENTKNGMVRKARRIWGDTCRVEFKAGK